MFDPQAMPSPLGQREQVVAERRRQQRSQRVGRLFAWVLPLQLLVALGLTLDHHATWPPLLGLPTSPEP